MRSVCGVPMIDGIVMMILMRVGNITNFFSQLMVEDDAGSDGEIERLSSIIEEEEVVNRWVRRRSNGSSNASVNGAVHSYDICDL